MSLALSHRRLTVAAALFALLAYGGGVGPLWPSGWIAGAVLALALFWSPPADMAQRIEQLWLPVAMLLVARAIFAGFVLRVDLVLPVVDLLLLLLCAETLRPLQASNHSRLYALVFALVLASTAYRPGLVFAFAFLGVAVTLIPALVVGHLLRESDAHGLQGPRSVSELRSPAFAAAVSTVVFAVFVFVAFPRVSRDTIGRTPGTSTTVAGFADAVTLGNHGSTIGNNPEVVLRVEFPSGNPPDPSTLYWRGRSYDRFDGTRWTRTRGLRPSRPPPEWYQRRWPGEDVEQMIYSARLNARILPALHPVTQVQTTSTVHPLFDSAGDLLYWGGGDPVYRATSKARRPPADSLRAARGNFFPGGRAFLQLPELDIEIPRLAAALVDGIDSRYDRVMAIRDYFHREFTYTRQLPPTAGEATLDHFLFERRSGHCEYFSTAMVVLLRSIGIESREVNGFLGGEWNTFGRYLAVTQNQAHSWVEVWFPGYGWVTFDPTPSTVAGEAAAPSFRWPGLLFLDGLRHRWNKWVLDYSPERQSALLDRLRGDENVLVEPEEGGPASPAPWGTLVGIGVLLAGLGFVLRIRRGPSRPLPETRAFQRLRDTYARLSGLEHLSEAGPLEFIRTIEERGLPFADEAEGLARRYMGARFSGGPEPGVDGLRSDVKRLISRLRSRPTRRLLRAAGG